MSPTDSSKQERIEEFLRKSLLGDDLINTQFHLFSARSVSSGRLTKPRVLCANNVLLAKSSTYFVDLLSSDVNPTNNDSLSDITDADDVPSHVKIEDYGYESDSDFDDDDLPVPVDGDVRAPKVGLATASTNRPQISSMTEDDEELSEDGSESSVNSDMFVMSPEHPTVVNLSLDDINAVASVTCSKTAVQVQESSDDKVSADQTGVRLRSLGSRHVLIKDTAFQTWYSLLNYLYTNKISFLPLNSATLGTQPRKSSTNSSDEPRCSAKSMYRLACKVGLDQLRDEALAHIRSNLTEHNILKEMSRSIVANHPQLLEMQLDVLYTHIRSAPVVAEFPAFAHRIAQKELPHGANIIIGIHSRLLMQGQPLRPTPTPLAHPFVSPTLATVEPSLRLWGMGSCSASAGLKPSSPLPTSADLDPPSDEAPFWRKNKAGKKGKN